MAAKTATPEVIEVPVLRGETAPDKSLLDEAVEELNLLYAVKGMETAVAIGEYVIDTFFDGDAANYHAKGKKHVSFRELGKRPDLYVSYSFINRAVGVVEQLKVLPDGVGRVLPLSHHRLLLPIKDEKEKLRLAKEAAEKGLSKRALEKRIAKTREKKPVDAPSAGRPTLPAFVKGFTKLGHAVELATADEEISFEHYSPKKTRKLLDEMEQQIEQLVELKERVLNALDKWEASTGEKG